VSVTSDNLWTIDGLVAAGTLALAVSTLILALFTLYTARKTKQLAVMSRDEVLAVKEQATISRNVSRSPFDRLWLASLKTCHGSPR